MASHWSQLEERGVYLGLRFMVAAYRLFGRTGFSLFLFPVMAYFFVANPKVRAVSQDFLTRVYDDPRGRGNFRRRPGWREVYRHMFTFGAALLDKLAAWVGEINETNTDFRGREHFEALVRSGRGGLIVASHLGNSEVSRALGTTLTGGRINVLVHTKHSGNFNRVMRQVNPASVVDLIQVTEIDPGVAMMLNEKVANGEFVVIVGDRTPVVQGADGAVGRYSWASFLGRLAPFPQGPFILAGLLKCPVLTMFCLKREGRYRIEFEPFADEIRLPRGERQAALDGYIARYAARLEGQCLTAPYQWFNFFDFWGQAGTMPPQPETMGNKSER